MPPNASHSLVSVGSIAFPRHSSLHTGAVCIMVDIVHTINVIAPWLIFCGSILVRLIEAEKEKRKVAFLSFRRF